MKKCTKCNTFSELVMFCKDSSKKDGLHPHCKTCRSKRGSQYRQENRDDLIAKQREYRKKNIDAIRKKDNLRNKCEKRKAYKNSRNRYYLVKNRSLNKAFNKEVELIYRVASFLSKYENKRYEVDHIEPLQGSNSMGLHVPWNLQILERSENRSKGNKLITANS